MFFPDLTPYEYGREEPQANVLNVGWLSNVQPFPTGTPPDRFVAILKRLVQSPVNPYRGLHFCEFCPEPPVRVDQSGGKWLDSRPEASGNGEIRVAGPGGVVYVAPVLVAHYVEVHKYLPPAEFIEAVISFNGIASA